MRSATRAATTAALLDAVVIVLFAVIGRSSHAEDVTVAGVVTTAWPFLAGAGLGWLAARAWRAPMRVRWSGITVWLGALAGGMALRVIAGQGTAISFVVVAGAFLGLFLLGWRGLVVLARRSRPGPLRQRLSR